ncbi:MAG: ParB/RepB/Spo0J family partition protein [Actinomycetota bacterium]
MAARKSGLGRGLDALIPQDSKSGAFETIPVGEIDPNPEQPRDDFDEHALESLAASIESIGLLQPIVVRRAGDRYALVAGERRLRAAKLAGLESIPVVLRSETDSRTNLMEALVENLQREDLTVIEEATAYRQLMEDFGMQHDEVATEVGKSRSAVTNTVRLLGLPSPIQELLVNGGLTPGHGRALLGTDDEAYAIHIARRAVAEGWTVRRVEEAMRLRSTQMRRSGQGDGSPRPAAIIELEERLQEKLGTKVRIDYRGKGGKITIKYASADDLERIYRHLFDPSG